MPKIRRYLVGSVIVALAIGAAFAVGTGTMPRSGYSEGDIEAELRVALPVGTSYQQIDTWLSRRGIVHSFVAKEHRVYGLIPDIQRGLLVTKSIQIIIALDSQEKLTSVEVKPVYTGP